MNTARNLVDHSKAIQQTGLLIVKLTFSVRLQNTSVKIER